MLPSAYAYLRARADAYTADAYAYARASRCTRLDAYADAC